MALASGQSGVCELFEAGKGKGVLVLVRVYILGCERLSYYMPTECVDRALWQCAAVVCGRKRVMGATAGAERRGRTRAATSSETCSE